MFKEKDVDKAIRKVCMLAVGRESVERTKGNTLAKIKKIQIVIPALKHVTIDELKNENYLSKYPYEIELLDDFPKDTTTTNVILFYKDFDIQYEYEYMNSQTGKKKTSTGGFRVYYTFYIDNATSLRKEGERVWQN